MRYGGCSAEHGLHSIAFPNISTGIYGFPKELASPIAIKTVRDFLAQRETSIREIQFVCFDDDNFRLYQQKVAR
ncbi:macro domain-containing protein [Larkinella sp. C7]|uniref:macro domain-containing protein n=1 Tax=Larkinella sp. C7 TaxID=2576607 RepID=UPI001E409A63|nr:macro domain-containing protein [Larkinella sp. C7]